MQPDCNFPTAESFRKQMEAGQEYFRSRFGKVPTVGFNPDAFGHSASLPDLLSEYGYKYYVHMRPEESRMPLESPLYRWRGVGGKEILSFRIVHSYNGMIPGWFDAEVEGIPKTKLAEFGHALAFIGCGDHGGGATSDLIEYVHSKRNAYPDTEIKFSTFEKFFSEVEPLREKAPVKEGELHYFAVGCYSVNREIKTNMRAAEHALIACEGALKKFGDSLSNEQYLSAHRHIGLLWKQVLFNQFHDILPGSLIGGGKEDAVRELGAVIAYCQDLMTLITRRVGLEQPEHESSGFSSPICPTRRSTATSSVRRGRSTRASGTTSCRTRRATPSPSSAKIPTPTRHGGSACCFRSAWSRGRFALSSCGA